MISKKLKQEYLDFLTEMIHDFGYSDIDCFAEDNELSEKEVKELLNLNKDLEVFENQILIEDGEDDDL